MIFFSANPFAVHCIKGGKLVPLTSSANRTQSYSCEIYEIAQRLSVRLSLVCVSASALSSVGFGGRSLALFTYVNGWAIPTPYKVRHRSPHTL